MSRIPGRKIPHRVQHHSNKHIASIEGLLSVLPKTPLQNLRDVPTCLLASRAVSDTPVAMAMRHPYWFPSP